MIELIDETGRLSEEDLSRLEQAVSSYVAEVDPGGAIEGIPRLTLVLVSDDEIAGMNVRDRQVDGPTDVLSYPAVEPDDDGFPPAPHLGDIIISLDTAAAQAREAGVSLMAELLMLAGHGVTHLLGFDHGTEEQWQIFQAAQDRVQELGGIEGSQRRGLGPA